MLKAAETSKETTIISDYSSNCQITFCVKVQLPQMYINNDTHGFVEWLFVTLMRHYAALKISIYYNYLKQINK